MYAVTGRVFDVSMGCVDDGPGLRTVVFLKGCHLDCPWCHNIEGKSFEREIAFDVGKCIGCGRCLEACPRDWPPSLPIDHGFDRAASTCSKSALPEARRPSLGGFDNAALNNAWRSGCTACGRCAEVCPSRARRLVGRDYEVDELAAEVTKDVEFFSGTGGGITFSGGEPLAQSEFLFACADALRAKGIHLAVETSGFWPPRLLSDATKRFDLILFDVKHVEPERFRKATGRDNSEILSNLRKLLATDVAMELRIPLIPGFNDSDADLGRIADWLRASARIPPARLLPLHRLAVAKQAIFGRGYPYAGVALLPEKRPAEAAELLRRGGVPVIL